MKDISASFATTILIQIVNILTGLLAARLLLPEGRGELAELLLWPGLLIEFGILAMSDALMYRAATRAASPRVLFATVFWIGVALTVLLLSVGYFALPYVFADNSGHVAKAAWWYVPAFIPVYLLSLFVATMFQGHLDILAWNVVRAVVGLGYLVFIGAFFVLDAADLEGFAVAYIAGNALSAGIGLFWLQRKGWLGWRPDFAVARSMLAYGARVHVGEMVNSLRQRVDQIAVSLYLASADMGLYVVALTVANGPMILVNTVAGIAFPKISAAGTPGEKLAIFGAYLRLAVGMSLATAVSLAVLAEYLVPLIFGARFYDSATLCQITLIGLPFFAAKLMFIQALNAFDRSLAIGWAEAAGLIAAALALAGLLPTTGVYGAAWAMVVANVVAFAAMAAMLNRQIGAPVLALFRPQASDLEPLRRLVAKVRR